MITAKEESDTDGPNVAEDGLSKDGTCEVGHMSKHTHTSHLTMINQSNHADESAGAAHRADPFVIGRCH